MSLALLHVLVGFNSVVNLRVNLAAFLDKHLVRLSWRSLFKNVALELFGLELIRTEGRGY